MSDVLFRDSRCWRTIKKTTTQRSCRLPASSEPPKRRRIINRCLSGVFSPLPFRVHKACDWKTLEFYSGTATDWSFTAALKLFVLQQESLFVQLGLGEYEWQKEMEHLCVHVNVHPRLCQFPGVCVCVFALACIHARLSSVCSEMRLLTAEALVSFDWQLYCGVKCVTVLPFKALSSGPYISTTIYPSVLRRRAENSEYNKSLSQKQCVCVGGGASACGWVWAREKKKEREK